MRRSIVVRLHIWSTWTWFRSLTHVLYVDLAVWYFHGDGVYHNCLHPSTAVGVCQCTCMLRKNHGGTIVRPWWCRRSRSRKYDIATALNQRITKTSHFSWLCDTFNVPKHHGSTRCWPWFIEKHHRFYRSFFYGKRNNKGNYSTTMVDLPWLNHGRPTMVEPWSNHGTLGDGKYHVAFSVYYFIYINSLFLEMLELFTKLLTFYCTVTIFGHYLKHLVSTLSQH